MSQQAKCLKCGQLRPSDELICGACGAFLQPPGRALNTETAALSSAQTSPNQTGNVTKREKYAEVNVIKYVRRPMNQWLAVGTDYFNFYFLEDKLVVAKVSSGRFGLFGALIGLPFYLIVALITVKVGAMLDEKFGKGQCDTMASRLTEIVARPSAYKLATYKYGQRVVIEKNDTCNSNNMGHKINIEGNEYFFDEFEMDIAREKFQKYFDVLPAAA